MVNNYTPENLDVSYANFGVGQGSVTVTVVNYQHQFVGSNHRYFNCDDWLPNNTHRGEDRHCPRHSPLNQAALPNPWFTQL